MAGRSVIHETFRIERAYAAPPSTVFAAFSTEEARSSWGDTDDLGPPEDEGDDSEAARAAVSTSGSADESPSAQRSRERRTVTTAGITT